MSLINIEVQFKSFGQHYTYLAYEPVAVGDTAIVDSPYNGPTKVKVVSVGRPVRAWDKYVTLKTVERIIPQEKKAMTTTTPTQEIDFTKEKFCIIGAKASGHAVNNRTWLDTYKEAEAYAKSIIKAEHDKGNTRPLQLLVVKTVAMIETPQPNIIIKMVRAWTKSKKKKI